MGAPVTELDKGQQWHMPITVCERFTQFLEKGNYTQSKISPMLRFCFCSSLNIRTQHEKVRTWNSGVLPLISSSFVGHLSTSQDLVWLVESTYKFLNHIHSFNEHKVSVCTRQSGKYIQIIGGRQNFDFENYTLQWYKHCWFSTFRVNLCIKFGILKKCTEQNVNDGKSGDAKAQMTNTCK